VAGKRIELVGAFGTLRVLSRAEPDAQRRARWNCVCDSELGGCGRELIVRGDSLTSGKTRSCGQCHGTESPPTKELELSPRLALLFPRFQMNVIPSRYGGNDIGVKEKKGAAKCPR
jgi:hypothetical protein